MKKNINNRQKITCENVKYLSTHSLEQRLGSYFDLLEKRRCNIYGLPYRLYFRICVIRNEYYKRIIPKYREIITHRFMSVKLTFGGKNGNRKI